jgi:hypothetical protein
MLRDMTTTSVSIRDLTLIAAYAAFLVIYFGYGFFGMKRALAGAGVISAMVLIALLPSWAGLLALLAGFLGLIATSAHLHKQATAFNTGAIVLLSDRPARQTGA